MKISAVFVSYNDLVFLRNTVAYARAWADQVCVLDMASSDGTTEFCAAYLGKSDRYLRREMNTVPTLGDAEAKNAAAEMADGDWIVNLDADLMPHWEDAAELRRCAQNAEKEIISSWCYDVRHDFDGPCWALEKAAAQSLGPIPHSRHGKIYKRASGWEFKGYLHAELYSGETNWGGHFDMHAVRMLHFSNMRPIEAHRVKLTRSAWMMKRAMENPDLQRWTNRWWYEVFWKENESALRESAAQYEAIGTT